MFLLQVPMIARVTMISEAGSHCAHSSGNRTLVAGSWGMAPLASFSMNHSGNFPFSIQFRTWIKGPPALGLFVRWLWRSLPFDIFMLDAARFQSCHESGSLKEM